MSRQRAFLFGITLIAGAGMLLSLQPRAESGQPKLGPDPQAMQKVVNKAVGFLTTSQNPDGSFSKTRFIPGVTALVTASLIKSGVSPQEPVVAKALKYLESKEHKDGGIYDKGLENYITAVAILAFKEANANGKYDSVIKSAGEFIKNIQHREDEADLNYGGFGYDKKTRPDMSNTGFSVEALLAAGLSKDDPAVKRAMVFITRCQNLPGEENKQAFAQKTTQDDKGGFVYNPNPDKNPYATTAGGLRSVGGMTYSGLKSFLYAGVSKKDPRVEAAVKWIRLHYTLEENPGMGKNGLYYYYQTFGKAMEALGEDPFVDAKGVKHDWRLELFQTMQKKQLENGSWRNTGERTFGEDNSELATSFALLSLSYCKATGR